MLIHLISGLLGLLKLLKAYHALQGWAEAKMKAF